jgi:hypothetical protein
MEQKANGVGFDPEAMRAPLAGEIYITPLVTKGAPLGALEHGMLKKHM